MNPGNDILKSGGNDYERPGNRYRCGRGALWRKPCHAGPTPEGHCGGIAECEPVLRNGKFECRRPKEAGGPCAEGPKPDGACAHCHPPCIPRLTLRARRGRLTWQLCGVALLLLAAGFHFGTRQKAAPLSADPGPLSAKHAHFTKAQGCAACHGAHDAGIGGLAKAVFAHADMNAKCTTCHDFSGMEKLPHNDRMIQHDGPGTTDCRMCHTEHRGPAARLTTIADAQCHTCHQAKFNSFSRDHPAFANFPAVPQAAIRFDHGKHLLDYFKQPAYAPRALNNCRDCHTASATEPRVRTAGFDAACARCHAEQIPQTELTVLRLPEPTAPADLPKLGADDATTFMAWVVQGNATNNADYGPKLGEWFRALTNGINALTRSIPTGLQVLSRTNLFDGLGPELLQRPLGLWLEQKKFEAAGSPVNGWYWMEDMYPELRYKPTGHSDPLVKTWVDFALNAPLRVEGNFEKGVKFRDEVTHPSTGAGRCLKCHAVSSMGKGIRRVEWTYSPPLIQPHTRFSHGVHVGLLNCADCHALDPKADYAGQFKTQTPASAPGTSNFKGMAVANCSSCHAEQKVRADCLLCHEYHRAGSQRISKSVSQ